MNRSVFETALINQYKPWISGIHKKYCFATGIQDNVELCRDVYNECILAFLKCCRKHGWGNAQFGRHEYSTCRLAMQSAMRVYIWREYGMGGCNTRPIHPKRVYGVLESIPLKFDESRLYVEDFIKTLTPIQRKVVMLAACGFAPNEISEKIHTSVSNVYKIISTLRRKIKEDMG